MSNAMNQTPSRAGKVAIRLVVASIAVLALGGPSPGHVGSCDGASEHTPYVDFCMQYQQWRCVRDYNGGRAYTDGSPPRIDGMGYQACAAEIGTRCSAGSYGVCGGIPNNPTRTQTDACIGAMADASRNGTLETALIECNFSSCGGI